MGDHGLGRQARLDQPRRRRCLNHAIGAGAAGVFRVPGDDDAELGRDHVQPLRYILADRAQAAATVTGQTVRLNDFFNAGKMLGQGSTIDRTSFGRSFVAMAICLFLGMNGRNGRFQILKRQVELVRVALFGFASEGRLLECATSFSSRVIRSSLRICAPPRQSALPSGQRYRQANPRW